MSIKVYEIFGSLQGESSRMGLPTVFVRLTGCPLRCEYCDTAYAFNGGKQWDIPSILDTVASFGYPYVCVTGGEPLAQKECLSLLEALCNQNYQVSLETSGALDISSVDHRVAVIMDIKTPASGEVLKNRWENISKLSSKDEIKFVIANRADYEWSKEMLLKWSMTQHCPVLFSPVYEKLEPATLAKWILEDKLPVRMQIQLHKLLWGEKPGV
jgi:7-carboxy-7-deazaguanine synthase